MVQLLAGAAPAAPMVAATPTIQRELLAYSKPHSERLSAHPGSISTIEYSADAPRVRGALQPLIDKKRVIATAAGDQVWFAERGAGQSEIAAAFTKAGFAKPAVMAKSLVDGHNVFVYANDRVSKITTLIGTTEVGKQSDTNERQTSRLPTDYERRQAKRVFGNSLDLNQFKIIEDPVMTVFGYARTTPRAVYLPPGTLTQSGITDWIIHEFTHAWQYQHGIGISDTLIEAIRARYDFGGPEQLKNDRKLGKRFTDYTTEQQAEICEDYWERLEAGRDVSAHQPFIDEVRDPSKPAPPNRSPVLDLNDRLLLDARLPLRETRTILKSSRYTCDPARTALVEATAEDLQRLIDKTQKRIDAHPDGTVDAATRQSIVEDVDASVRLAEILEKRRDSACDKKDKTACIDVGELPTIVASMLTGVTGGGTGGNVLAVGGDGPTAQTLRESAPSELTGLKRGDGIYSTQGDLVGRVKALQEALNLSGAGLAVDGMFGKGTGGAVMDFQSSRGLPRREQVDDVTADLLSGASPDDLVVTVSEFQGLRRGDGLVWGTWEKRPRVKGLQARLTVLGFAATSDGMFGPGTQSSLNGFQVSRGIPPSDHVDLATADALEGRDPPGAIPTFCPAGKIAVEPDLVTV